MIANSLQGVAERVVSRAQRQGSIAARDVRQELAGLGLDESFYKDVLALARPSLSYRRGRYHYAAPVSDRVRAEQSQQQSVQGAVAVFIEQHRAAAAAASVERREQGRVELVQPVKVITEDGRTLTLLTRDISATGIRLIGTQRLLGQKVHIFLPAPGGGALDCHVRILWTCPVADDLVENGGSFLGVSPV